MISFEDFKKVEIRVGQILSAEKIPDTDKLLKLSVDFGIKPSPTVAVGAGSSLGRSDTGLADHSSTNGLGVEVTGASVADAPVEAPISDIRQIISGIALYFPEASVLVGKQCMFVTNLEPRKIKGYESNGMLFAVSTEDGKFSLLEPNSEIPAGTLAK